MPYNPLLKLGIRPKPSGVMESLGFGPAMMEATPSTLDDSLASQGRNGDSIVAHINPQEAMLLKALGGSGRVNPATGMLAFESEGGNDAGSTGDDGNGNEGASGVGGDMGGYEGGFGGFGFGGGFGGFGAGEEAMGTAATSAEQEAANNRDADAANSIGGSFFGLEGVGPSPPGGFGDTDVENIAEMPHAKNTIFENMMDKISTTTLQDVMPSYTTLLGLLGMLSPVPGGLLMGRQIGKLGDEYGFSEPSAETAAAVAGGGTGEGSESSPLPDFAAPIVSNRTAVASGNTSGGQAQGWTPDMYEMWNRIANQGGGNLDRLFKSATAGMG